MAGFQRMAVRAAMYRTLRTFLLPPAMARWPREAPLSRLTGATPTRAATRRRVVRLSSGGECGYGHCLMGANFRRGHGAAPRRTGSCVAGGIARADAGPA